MEYEEKTENRTEEEKKRLRKIRKKGREINIYMGEGKKKKKPQKGQVK